MSTTHSIKKLPKNTVEITLNIPWATVSKEYDSAFDHMSKELTVEGFRKGKAPKNIAEKHLSKDKVFNHAIQHLLPAHYDEVVKKEDLKPIFNPKIELVKAKENEPWEVKLTVAQKPDIDLKNYKKIVQDAKKAVKGPEIWTPGKDKNEKEPTPEQLRERALQASLNALIDKIKVEISDVIVEDEVEKRTARLIDDLQRLGITVESYVKSKNMSVEDLRAQFKKEAEETYKMEFILSEIGEVEKIQVEKEDIDKMLNGLKDDKEKQAFMQNIYYYASLLRKQKILEFLITL